MRTRSLAWNFEYLDELPVRQCATTRLFLAPGDSDMPTLLLVHGGFHGAWCWTSFLALFTRAGIPSAALDLCGHGGQVPPDDFLTRGAEAMASDIAEAAAVLGGNVVLVGHSLGALAAMLAAKTVAPRGMILLAPAPPANVTDVRLLPPFPADTLVAPPPEDRARKWFLAGYSGDDIAPYVARLCAESPAFLNDLYERRIAVKSGWIKGPVLCLSGGKDDTALHRAGQDERIAAFYDAELITLPNAGHCMMLDDSCDTAASSIVAWLRRKELAARP